MQPVALAYLVICGGLSMMALVICSFLRAMPFLYQLGDEVYGL